MPSGSQMRIILSQRCRLLAFTTTVHPNEAVPANLGELNPAANKDEVLGVKALQHFHEISGIFCSRNT